MSLRKKSKPASKAKARERAQSALPGLEPSPTWQKMKAAPKTGKRPRVHRVDAGPGHPSWRQNVVPGKCTCDERVLEDGTTINSWALGHAYWCSMFMTECDDCGMSSGTHTLDCPFWKQHPEITPF